MDASYKIQRGIHVHLIQFFMCPEFWVHITANGSGPAFWVAQLLVPNRAQRSGRWERRSKGAEGGMPTHGRPDGSGLCDDEGDVAQYLGMDAFFNLK